MKPFYLSAIGWFAIVVLMATLIFRDGKRRAQIAQSLRGLGFLALMIFVLLAVGFWYHPEDFMWRINGMLGRGSVEDQRPAPSPPLP